MQTGSVLACAGPERPEARAATTADLLFRVDIVEYERQKKVRIKLIVQISGWFSRFRWSRKSKDLVLAIWRGIQMWLDSVIWKSILPVLVC